MPTVPSGLPASWQLVTYAPHVVGRESHRGHGDDLVDTASKVTRAVSAALDTTSTTFIFDLVLEILA